MSKRERSWFVTGLPGECRRPPRGVTLRYPLAILLLWACMVSLLTLRSAVAYASDAVGDDNRWKNLGNGALRDLLTKQEWLQEDNGDDIDWSSARSYCEGRHRGWRLPRLSELKAIYDEHAPGVRCAQTMCRVPPPFRLTGTWFWSATQVGKDSTDGIELAWGVLMTNGVPTQAVRDASYGSRVLCVRDP
jgi:Protein of unknown function (DUF1566)